MPDDKVKYLHEWIYEIVNTVSFDRDYIYRSYVSHFSNIMNEVFQGAIQDHGRYLIHGIKGDCDAEIEWQMSQRLNYCGLNTVKIRCTILQKTTGEIVGMSENVFELSNGEKLPAGKDDKQSEA